jgi:hypothetical protein
MHSGSEATPAPSSICGMMIEPAAKTTPKAKPALPTKLNTGLRAERDFGLVSSRRKSRMLFGSFGLSVNRNPKNI